ncbi:imidazole glycerol phosphate synthase subunit HisH [Campylobacter fetus]|nr:imidazole glycerol phosphate synthase subunit HisH [Campylobacter fetus]
MIGIIDYGAGNIKSVKNAFEYVGSKSELISFGDNLKKYDKLILPGVGAYGDAMQKLRVNGLEDGILEFIKSGKPFLGICLGMQLLFERGFEFGEHKGLGVIKGDVIKFDESKFNKHLKVPHIGWNSCEFKKECSINRGLPKSSYLYFVHSYHAVCDDESVLAVTTYGYEFVSAVCKDNIFGFQPHPEKSHENGLKIIKNFVEL